MTDIPIECPHCHKSFKLNETLAAPIIEETRRKLEKELEEKEDAFSERERAMAEEQKAFDKAMKELDKQRETIATEREKIEDEVQERLKAQRAEIVREESRKAKLKLEEKLAERDEQMKELEEAIATKDEKLAEAQKAEAAMRKKQRELDDKLREADLAVEKKVGEQLDGERRKARAEADESSRLKIAEREKTISDLQAKLQEAIRKAEQGSQQLQGEVQELDLEAALEAAFPQDQFEEVAKGQSGADTLQRVMGSTGQVCGSILWESKRTQRWQDGWLGKLRQDQRTAKAEIAIIVTQTMPDGVEMFEQIEGVWVTTPPLATALAGALRAGLVDTATARCASEGQQTKMAILYQYLTSPQFTQRVQAMMEGYQFLKDDLDGEKRAMQKRWAAREKQLEIVILATSGMYGDLQGIAGKTLPAIDGLELALPAGESSNGG